MLALTTIIILNKNICFFDRLEFYIINLLCCSLIAKLNIMFIDYLSLFFYGVHVWFFSQLNIYYFLKYFILGYCSLKTKNIHKYNYVFLTPQIICYQYLKFFSVFFFLIFSRKKSSAYDLYAHYTQFILFFFIFEGLIRILSILLSAWMGRVGIKSC